jgi:hypothetical protein
MPALCRDAPRMWMDDRQFLIVIYSSDTEVVIQCTIIPK